MKKTKMKLPTTLAGIALAFVAACSGEMTGVVRGEGTPIAIQFEQGMETDTLTAIIGGESFRGRSIPANATTTVANVVGDYGVFGMGTSISNQFVATLLGSRGSSIRCELTYASSMGDTSSGGVGVCQHSDGRLIDILW